MRTDWGRAGSSTSPDCVRQDRLAVAENLTLADTLNTLKTGAHL